MKKSLLIAVIMSIFSCSSMLAADYGLPADIQQGNILHCFNWPAKEVKAALPQIAAAGFGSVQLSPMQRADVSVGSEWHNLYRPYDLAFKSSSYCSEQDLKDLCTEAAKYGIKIIVDIVANHVDKTSGYHDPWWDSNGRQRNNGGINYGDRYSITHGNLGDYYDVNSESAEVIAKGKAYVEKLKSLGVKGCRWDAAKHIGLPSENCNFWSSVTSVSGMYHYGEILDNPGPNPSIIKEYAQFMSVTDNQYCNYAARDNGGIPTGYGGSWAVNYGLGEKCVYWAESHDTYANDEWSQERDQATIDRAYAAYACRKDATALYLSRPNAKGFRNIKVGKGSTAFTSKHISEVNKFRNVMVGKADWFESNGNACSITRKDGGAVIVMKGSGNVTVTNGGGYCPAGTYKDRVSGGTFTVTASTISGNVGSSGIAVLVKDGVIPDPTPGPGPTPNPDNGTHYIYYDGTNFSQPQVWAWTSTENCTSAGVWGGDNMTKKDGKWYWEVPAGKPVPEMIIIHEGDNKAGGGDLIYADKATYHQDGTYTVSSTPDPDPTPGPTPSNADMYILGNLGTGQWNPAKGVPMTKNGNVYTANGVELILPDAADATHSYFSLVTKLSDIEGNWDAVNGSDRYGAQSKDEAISVGQTVSVKKYAVGVDNVSGAYSWKILPGIYDMTFNMSTMQLTVKTASTTVVELPETTDVEDIYFTLQGVRVAEPEHGIYIRVRGSRAEKVVL